MKRGDMFLCRPVACSEYVHDGHVMKSYAVIFTWQLLVLDSFFPMCPWGMHWRKHMTNDDAAEENEVAH